MKRNFTGLRHRYIWRNFEKISNERNEKRWLVSPPFTGLERSVSPIEEGGGGVMLFARNPIIRRNDDDGDDDDNDDGPRAWTKGGVKRGKRGGRKLSAKIHHFTL